MARPDQTRSRLLPSADAPVPIVMSSSETNCPRCGAPNAAHLRYCAMCGTTLKPSTPPGTHTQAGTGTEAERFQVPRPQSVRPGSAGRGSFALTAPEGNPQVADFSATTAIAEPPGAVPSLAEPPNGVHRSAPAHSPSPPAATSPHCWRCGTRVPPEAAFCQACGAQLRAAPAAVREPISAAPRARLIVIAQDGSPGQEYLIEDGQIDIGREVGDIRLEGDLYACPRHARILWKSSGFYVHDLGSVNGVFARLGDPERLHHGDLVLVGLEVLRFEIVASSEAHLAPAVERGTRLFGSPSIPRYARLVERTVEGAARNVYYLNKAVTTIGRETGDIIFAEDPFMSRQHAALARQPDDSFVLKDLNSSNGTFIAIRDERLLPDGGHVRIGQHLFRLKVDG